MPLCFHILMISHTYYRKYVKQVHCHTTPYTYYGKVGGDFYFHSWILANKWYHIYTMQQKKVKKAAVCLCILNLYISQNTFLFKTYLCNNVMEFYYFDWIAARVTCMRKTKADVLVSICINMQCFLLML